MPFINYNTFDIEPALEAMDLIKKLGGKPIEDKEVWQAARDSEEIPSFENILISLTYQILEELIKKEYPQLQNANFETWVNCRDSSFFINGEKIFSLTDIEKVLQEMEEY